MTQTPTYAGIDVAKDRLDVVLRPSGEYVEATNDEQGIRSVVRRLRKEDVALAVLEATGGLEQPAAADLALAGVPVAIVNPTIPGSSGTSPRPRASSPRPTGSTPRCSPISPRR
jgi:transposase